VLMLTILAYGLGALLIAGGLLIVANAFDD
jgi:hypothetical protein